MTSQDPEPDTGRSKISTRLSNIVYNYYVRKIAYSIITLFGISILIFIIARVLPGDPARLALGPRAPEDVVEQYRQMLHLHEPLYIQYFVWLTDVFHGRLGISLVTFRDVTTDIIEFLPATVELIIFALVIDVIGAFSLGVLSGRRPNSAVDNFVRMFAYAGIAIPSFVWAIILQLILASWLGVLPAYGRLSLGYEVKRITGLVTLDSLLQGNIPAFFDALSHLIIPSLALAIGTIAQEARILRANLIENVSKDYILNMYSHGLPTSLVFFKYALKPSMIPTVTIMTLDMASLIGNAFLVEFIFNWPGLSRYGITAMLRKDLNAIVGVVLIIGLAYTLASIVIDLLISNLDPRIKHKR
ncbi:putative D,D-dipeptide transport system permease protein DdpB [Candidatus Calditenuaceae archaeon HR02]|nr:putative D,D-dipeptide transport system permease protein DdpB [Candidatus Calditenuaceae archaeon HR02]